MQAGTAMATAADPPLSAERLAAKALELIDSEGPEALSMRRLAAEVGAGTMTLYHYFASKQDLLDAVVDAAFAETELPEPEGSWRDQLASLVRSARAMLTRHPGIARLRAAQPILRADALRFGERALAILTEAGFGTEDAVRAFRLIFTYTLGFAILSPAATESDARAAARAAVAELPPESFPYITAAPDAVAGAMAGEAVFEFGLDRLLDGLEARLSAARRG